MFLPAKKGLKDILIYFILGVFAFFVFFAGENIIRFKNEIFEPKRQEEIINILSQKNKELEAEIFKLQIKLPERKIDYQRAKVYSNYPFSNKSEIVIDIGSLSGIKEGSAVTADGKNLIGKVKKVYNNISVVQTIFSPDFKIPVRIGLGEIDALYTGGLSPRLSLIANHRLDISEPRSAVTNPELDIISIQVGEYVVSASKDFPYGLVLGKIREITAKGRFKEATLEPIYEIKDLRNVYVAIGWTN
ncbi:MAG: hypothetical protein KY053_01330 [Candidatus Liptonbacteria bacterium]|nr:hypothetical protein [Candidatus Liptonbacteria bacterium]